MKNEIVSLRTAKLAKEKGFKKNCQYIYLDDGDLEQCFSFSGETMFAYTDVIKANALGYTYILAPEQAVLQRWLREEYNIKVTVDSSIKDNKGKWTHWHITINNKILIHKKDELTSYEKALEIGLLKGLHKIKN